MGIFLKKYTKIAIPKAKIQVVDFKNNFWHHMCRKISFKQYDQ